MKKWLSLFGALLFSGVAVAQTTIVVGVATDSDSTLWTNGTVSAQFVPNPSQPNLNVYRINGAPLSSAVIMQGPISLGSGGNFSITVYDNTQITPSGSQWQFTVCPNAISKCGSVTTSVSGSGQSITTLIDAAIPAPRFPAVAGSYGYADVEGILSTPVGGTYWNVVSTCQRYYNGSSWNCGSLPSGCVVGGAVPISCGGTGATTAAGALANLGGLPLSGGTLTGPLNGTSASFSGTVTAGTTNGIKNPCVLSGTTADAQINAALASVSSGGIVDARCYGTIPYNSTPALNQTIANTIVVGNDQTLLCDPSTIFEPSAASTQMLNIQAGGIVNGCTFNVKNVSYTGKAILFNTAISDGTPTILRNVNLIQSTTISSSVSGTGIDFVGSSGGISFVRLDHVQTVGFTDPLLLDDSAAPSASYFVNGNIFTDFKSKNGANCIHLKTGGISNAVVMGNIFIAPSCQAGPASLKSIWLDATTQYSIQTNTFNGVQIWDYASNTFYAGTGSSTNYFQGSMEDSSTNDAGSGNVVFSNDISHNTPTLKPGKFNYLAGIFVSGGYVLPSFTGCPSFASGSAALIGWNCAGGNGDTDYYTNLNVGSGYYAHRWWGPNSGATAWQSLMGLTNSGRLDIGSINSPGLVSGLDLAATGCPPFAVGSSALTGWNCNGTGNGEADYYTNLNTGTASYAHAWWGVNGGSTAFQRLMSLTNGGILQIQGSYNNPNGTVIPQTAVGYQGPAAGYVLTGITGSVALVSGTATVSTSAACAIGTSCSYHLTNCGNNASSGIGTLSVGTISAGTSFVINSLSPVAAVLTTDASTVCWQIN